MPSLDEALHGVRLAGNGTRELRSLQSRVDYLVNELWVSE